MRLSDFNRLAIQPSKQLSSSRNNIRVKNDINSSIVHYNSITNQNITERSKNHFDNSIFVTNDDYLENRSSIENDSLPVNSKRSIPINKNINEKGILRSSRFRLKRLIEASASPATISQRNRMTNRSSSTTAILIQKNFNKRSFRETNNKSIYSRDSNTSKKTISPYKSTRNILKGSNYTLANTTRTNGNAGGMVNNDFTLEGNFSSTGGIPKNHPEESIVNTNLMSGSRRRSRLKQSYSILDFKIPKSRDLSGNISQLKEENKKFLPKNNFSKTRRNLGNLPFNSSNCNWDMNLGNSSGKKRQELMIFDEVEIKANEKFNKKIEFLNKEIRLLKNKVKIVDKEIKEIYDSGFEKSLKVEKILKTSSKKNVENIIKTEQKFTKENSMIDFVDITPNKLQGKRRKELSLTNIKMFKDRKSRRDSELKTNLKNQKTKSLTNISFTAQKLKFDLKAVSFQIEKISRKHKILLKENQNNKIELEKKYKKFYQNQKTSNMNLIGCEEDLKKNVELKTILRKFQKKMGNILKRKVKEIEETCKTQLEMEVKLLEMRYNGSMDLIKRDIEEYVNDLVQKNHELKRYKLTRFQFK